MAHMNPTSSIQLTDMSNEPTSNVDGDSADNRPKKTCYWLRKHSLACFFIGFALFIVVTICLIVIFRNDPKATRTTMRTTKTTRKELNNKTHMKKWNQNGYTILHNKANAHFESICIDGDDGRIYVSENVLCRVMEWNYLGENGRVVAGGNKCGHERHQLKNPTAVAIDKKTDSIIICDEDNRRVVRWSRRNATKGDVIISNIRCYGLTIDDRGFLYVTDGEKAEVRRWNIGYKENTVVAGGNGIGDRLNQFRSPMYLLVDKDYSLYVTDIDNNRVMKWLKDANEGIIVSTGSDKKQPYVPYGLAVDNLGNIYTSDRYNNRIISSTDRFQTPSVIIGGKQAGLNQNQLNQPTGFSFDKYGNLFVIDSDNRRIQKFNLISE